MKVEISGAKLLAFWKEWHFGANVYVEEAPFGEADDGTLRWHDGAEDEVEISPILDPEKTYIVGWGTLGWQGTGPTPQGWTGDLRYELKKWLDKRTTSSFVVEVLPHDVERFREFCKQNSFKISYVAEGAS